MIIINCYLIIITRSVIWIWFWCHITTRYCSTIKALQKGSAGFRVTMYFAGRPRFLRKTSFNETCCHTGCSENFSACFPSGTGLLIPPQFFLSLSFSYSKIHCPNKLASFASLYFSLDWSFLKKFEIIYFSVMVSWKGLCIVFICLSLLIL